LHLKYKIGRKGTFFFAYMQEKNRKFEDLKIRKWKMENRQCNFIAG